MQYSQKQKIKTCCDRCTHTWLSNDHPIKCIWLATPGCCYTCEFPRMQQGCKEFFPWEYICIQPRLNLCKSDSGQMCNMYCVFPINPPPANLPCDAWQSVGGEGSDRWLVSFYDPNRVLSALFGVEKHSHFQAAWPFTPPQPGAHHPGTSKRWTVNPEELTWKISRKRFRVKICFRNKESYWENRAKF